MKSLTVIATLLFFACSFVSCDQLCKSCLDDSSLIKNENDSLKLQIQNYNDDLETDFKENQDTVNFVTSTINNYLICVEVVKPAIGFADATFRVYDLTKKRYVFQRGLNQLQGVRIYTKRQAGNNYELHVEGVGARDKNLVTQQKDFNTKSDFKISLTKDFFKHNEASPLLIGGTDARDSQITDKDAVLADLWSSTEGSISPYYYIHFNDRSATTGTLYLGTSGSVNNLMLVKADTTSLGVSKWGCTP